MISRGNCSDDFDNYYWQIVVVAAAAEQLVQFRVAKSPFACLRPTATREASGWP